MKIGHIVTESGPVMALYHEGSYFDLSEITGVDMEYAGNSFYFNVEKNLERVQKFVSEGKLESMLEISPQSYLIPIPAVNQIRDFYAFEEHVRNARKRRGLEVPPEWYEFPAYYYSGNSAILPSDTEVERPSFTNELDFELEIAAVIGREGKNIPRGEAMSHIFGFILMSDWSARDQQRKEMAIGLGPSKSKDFATSFGRNIVTADEVEGLMDDEFRINAEVSVEVNDHEITRNNLNTMHWTFQDLVSWASTGVSLKPGDVIMSGTVGKGCILELGTEVQEWLQPGDAVTFKSAVFGELRSKIA